MFNGGAWLTIDGRRVDVHYRDLDVVEHERSEAEAGRFRVEPLLFHLAGIPSYLVVAELAINRVLRGTLDRPDTYPPKLRASAPERWYGSAGATLSYAKAAHAPKGRLTEVAGALALAATQTAHAVLAARGSGAPTRNSFWSGRDCGASTGSWRVWGHTPADSPRASGRPGSSSRTPCPPRGTPPSENPSNNRS